MAHEKAPGAGGRASGAGASAGGASGKVSSAPSTHAKKGGTVRTTVVPTPFGAALVAVSAVGVASVMFGDDEARLEAEVVAAFPGAAVRRDDEGLAALGRRVADLLAHPERVGGAPLEEALGVPLDEGGTPFQRQVWRALRAIPAGTTCSYTELAVRLGRPSAARAVARACATNRIAVLTPCHRVVRSGGGLAGYRWGVERKRALLAREAAAVLRSGISRGGI